MRIRQEKVLEEEYKGDRGEAGRGVMATRPPARDG